MSGIPFLCNLSQADAPSLQGCSAPALPSQFAEALLKQAEERAWKRSTSFALGMFNLSDRAEAPILP